MVTLILKGGSKMKNNIKRILSLTLIFIFTVLLLPISLANAEEKNENSKAEGTNIEARSALLMEPMSGKILYEKNYDNVTYYGSCR
jgi:D-alanyl-D-alanine carboxypeptidase (penicillin-binding protein 5/6)